VMSPIVRRKRALISTEAIHVAFQGRGCGSVRAA
jgi:hypothetical protein